MWGKIGRGFREDGEWRGGRGLGLNGDKRSWMRC